MLSRVDVIAIWSISAAMTRRHLQAKAGRQGSHLSVALCAKVASSCTLILGCCILGHACYILTSEIKCLVLTGCSCAACPCGDKVKDARSNDKREARFIYKYAQRLPSRFAEIRYLVYVTSGPWVTVRFLCMIDRWSMHCL
jgi:hypothetical protein